MDRLPTPYRGLPEAVPHIQKPANRKRESAVTQAQTIRLADYRAKRRRGTSRRGVFFDRHELRQLLEIYSRRVMSGEWKDYAIDQRGESAVFSIFRHSFDTPLFAITKRPNGKRCDYLVFRGPRKLKHGSSIDEVLSVFDHRLREI